LKEKERFVVVVCVLFYFCVRRRNLTGFNVFREAEERVAAALAAAREQERRQQDERARLEALERESKSMERQQMIQQAQARAQSLEQQANEAAASLAKERGARQDLAAQMEKERAGFQALKAQYEAQLRSQAEEFDRIKVCACCGFFSYSVRKKHSLSFPCPYSSSELPSSIFRIDYRYILLHVMNQRPTTNLVTNQMAIAEKVSLEAEMKRQREALEQARYFFTRNLLRASLHEQRKTQIYNSQTRVCVCVHVHTDMKRLCRARFDFLLHFQTDQQKSLTL